MTVPIPAFVRCSLVACRKLDESYHGKMRLEYELWQQWRFFQDDSNPPKGFAQWIPHKSERFEPNPGSEIFEAIAMAHADAIRRTYRPMIQ